MNIYYADFNKAIGYNYYNEAKPFYMLNDFIVIIERHKSRKYLKIPKNYSSDGCTIWKPFRFILGCPHTPRYIPASIIHDYILDNPAVIKFNRRFASEVFFHTLIKEGVNPFKASIMFLAVDFWQWLKNLFVEKWI
jgi:hypothetical protein